MEYFNDKDNELYYYDCNNNFNEISNIKLIGSGGYGDVFRKDDICYKLIKKSTNYLHLEYTREIQDLDLDSMFKILEYMYKEDNSILGYVMPYYEAIKDFDILTMSSEYLIYNYKKLYEAMTILGNHSIYCEDLRGINTICTNNNIVIIDTDLYHKNYPRTIAILRNRELLTELMKEYILKAYSNYHLNDMEYKPYFLGSLFSSEPSLVAKTFSKYRKPIDYLRSK